jgi:hypothetical protein
MTQTRSCIEAAPLGWLLVSRIVAGMITRDRKWVGTLPPGLEASATVDALRAICALDLEPGILHHAKRGWDGGEEIGASVGDRCTKSAARIQKRSSRRSVTPAA